MSEASAMTVSGMESISQAIQQPGYFVKCILADSAATFFPGTIQHRDIKRHGLSYEDDYRGNAMAATITPGRMDIRFHPAYPEEKVRTICRRLVQSPGMEWLGSFAVSYQGRTLS
jgi:hypothetical protein